MNEIDIDAVISNLRVELDRIDRAILVFEKMALEMRAGRRKAYRAVSVRHKRAEAHQALQTSASPS